MTRQCVFIFGICFSLVTNIVGQTAVEGRQKISFNSGWLFSKGDRDASLPDRATLGWQSVQFPHTWNDKDVLADGERGYYRGIGWYKKNFRLQPEEGKKYFLRFEGVNQEAEIFVNGKAAGKHIGGYSAFNIELTPFLDPSAEQYISVKVDNSFNENIPPLSADFTFSGGIYRPVHLITTGEQHFSMSDYGGPGVYVSTPRVTSQNADVHIEYHLENGNAYDQALTIETIIQKESSSALARKKTTVIVPALQNRTVEVICPDIGGFELWSPDNPAMYYVESHLFKSGELVDNLTQPFGFRWFHFDPEKGFFLNGENLKLMGANRHQDRIPYGNALSDDMHRQDMRLLKDMGANFLRTAHYPQATEILDNADQLGLLVWEEIPLVNEVTISREHDENAEMMLKEMIRQHYNHPSVIIWAYMNEIYWAHRFKPEEELPARNRATLALARKLEDLARELDPYRYTAMAMHNYPAYEETGLGDIPMIAGWNLYHGWYYGNHEDFGKFMDEQRLKYPRRIHFISEYGAGSDVRLYSEKPEKFDFTIEEQINFTRAITRQILDRPYIAGGALWNLIDFSSERRVDATSHINNKGLVTVDRKPKDAYYLVQAMLSEKPVSEWGYSFRQQWVHAAVSPSDTLVPVRMYAFSNQKTLSLYVNNRFSAESEVKDGMAEWLLCLPPGKHLLSLGQNSTYTPEKRIETTLIPFHLKDEPTLDIAMNLGVNYAFIDSRTGLYWIPEREHRSGSWGIIGGKQLYIGDKVGTKEDILAADEEDPLYQTMRVDPSEFRADVPDGTYEIELLMVDYVRKSRRFADEDKEITYEPGRRVFGISVNGRVVEQAIDMGGSYGLNVPYRLVFRHTVKDNAGLSIQFHPFKREPVVSAIRIRSVRY
ncbi:glycoside hydrolase family 2 TIM barrel-domain containing protein [Proteiniphilum sp. X52]|uniref:glycoside hydrolase family 2 TIM barrel-domain containing protein n=1 Tax=Proteiniphilum sp. X52 TaxID=2382159 RepID=UPI000F0A1117|nr:glycoside hydrolase family 2 TIM barrel-domain containing protein [Proteiniphilum sp. X52]RNC63654.1 glycoside hydrolase family 2 [Proteiniphilum sp. X52]